MIIVFGGCGEREFLKLRSLFHNRFKALLSSRHPFGLAHCGKIIQKVSIKKSIFSSGKSEKVEKWITKRHLTFFFRILDFDTVWFLLFKIAPFCYLRIEQSYTTNPFLWANFHSEFSLWSPSRCDATHLFHICCSFACFSPLTKAKRGRRVSFFGSASFLCCQRIPGPNFFWWFCPFCLFVLNSRVGF